MRTHFYTSLTDRELLRVVDRTPENELLQELADRFEKTLDRDEQKIYEEGRNDAIQEMQAALEQI